jgi:hypothetical protein
MRVRLVRSVVDISIAVGSSWTTEHIEIRTSGYDRWKAGTEARKVEDDREKEIHNESTSH